MKLSTILDNLEIIRDGAVIDPTRGLHGFSEDEWTALNEAIELLENLRGKESRL